MTTDYSDYAEQNLSDNLLGEGAALSHSAVYMSLHTSDPGEGGYTGEISDAQYGRQQLSVVALGQGPTGRYRYETDTDVTFNFDSSHSGISHAALYDSGTVGEGNMILASEIGTAFSVAAGSSVTFFAGNIKIVTG